MEWKNWSYVLFSERACLPSCSGIYVIADANNFVRYVDQAADLKSRWAGTGHHRYAQLIRSNRKLCHKIYWKQVQVINLNEQERYYINLYKPELNGCKILPKQNQVEHEIKYLLEVLNPTLRFPVIRSMIAGEYEGDDGIRCILVVRNVKDLNLLSRSMLRHWYPEVREAWVEYKTYCGKDEQHYNCKWLYAYSFNKHRFEFVES